MFWGNLLAGKHLLLGLAVKALTGIKNIVTIMNRYRYWASSETICRIDVIGSNNK